jgi:hypothetical protein
MDTGARFEKCGKIANSAEEPWEASGELPDNLTLLLNLPVLRTTALAALQTRSGRGGNRLPSRTPWSYPAKRRIEIFADFPPFTGVFSQNITFIIANLIL